jgi:methylthioribulose 1-phosphate dehydratase/enolase-phosphatase E1
MKVHLMEIKGITNILLDIEGTTTPISFVHDKLFPYARQNFSQFLINNLNNEFVKTCIVNLYKQYEQDSRNGLNPPLMHSTPEHYDPEELLSYILWLMDNDRKVTPLKELQGKIWESGYKSGDIVSQMYADVPIKLSLWYEGGLKISIYSSGSILSQKLLFGNTSYGDLTKYIYKYFDTTMGSKLEVSSYLKISSILDNRSNHILFISDSIQEVKSSNNAGMNAIVIDRYKKKHTYETIESFSELQINGF